MDESLEATVSSDLIEILDAFDRKEIDFDTAYSKLDVYVCEQILQQDRLTQSYTRNEINSLRGEIRKLKQELRELRA